LDTVSGAWGSVLFTFPQKNQAIKKKTRGQTGKLVWGELKEKAVILIKDHSVFEGKGGEGGQELWLYFQNTHC